MCGNTSLRKPGNAEFVHLGEFLAHFDVLQSPAKPSSETPNPRAETSWPARSRQKPPPTLRRRPRFRYLMESSLSQNLEGPPASGVQQRIGWLQSHRNRQLDSTARS